MKRKTIPLLSILPRCLVLLYIFPLAAAASETTTEPTGWFSDLQDTSKPENHWSLSLEAIALKRSNSSVSQSLTNTVPAGFHWTETQNPSNSSELFNSNQINQGFQVGPKVTIGYNNNPGEELELTYFNVLNLNSTNTTNPNGNWLTMYAPGFWQTQDYPNQGMSWTSTTNLYSTELNAKSSLAKNLKLLAGFRWIQLNDSLTGAVTPPDQYSPTWKINPICNGHLNPTFNILENCTFDNSQPSNFSTFWKTSTTNNLFGLQLGAEGDLFSIGNLSLGGSIKVGVYDNRSTQSSWASMNKQLYYASKTSNQAAYAGDATLQIKYRVTNNLAIKAGYALLWLDRIALAPGQIPLVSAGQNPTTFTATGVNTGSNVLFQGGTLGIEQSF